MKVILVIQSIIILAGAIYIFTLQQQESADDEVVPAELPPLPPPPVPAPSADEAVVPEIPPATDIAGPNDAGMEWPVIESDLEVQ